MHWKKWAMAWLVVAGTVWLVEMNQQVRNAVTGGVS